MYSFETSQDHRAGPGTLATVDPALATDRPFAPVEVGVEAMAAGRPIIVLDDEDRENEGDLVLAAQFATPELVAFFVRYTSGLLCVAMDDGTTDRLQLPPMVAEDSNQDSHGTAFTVSVDLIEGNSTGISAADRAATARALADPSARPDQFARPGHMFPLRARPGGVLERSGHTEASVDLARRGGLSPVALISEIVNDDGTMARGAQLGEFGARHGLALVSIADLVGEAYRG